jgi:flavin prenyltransferase
VRIFVGITGASGSIYAQRLIQELLSIKVDRIYVCASQTAKKVIAHELSSSKQMNINSFCLKRLLQGEIRDEHKKTLRLFAADDFFAPIASGSSAASHVIVIPCSMGSLARIRCGISSNLIERSSDVSLKQKKKLILCPRETPFSTIHLENMLALSKMGVDIVPPIPGFYQRPQSLNDIVDFFIGKIFELLDIEHSLYRAWNKRLR